jgi:hypothetical protein
VGARTMNGTVRQPLFVLSLACLIGLASTFTPSSVEAQSEASGALDTSRVPRISGAKEVFANAATTIVTTSGRRRKPPASC